MIDAIRRVKHEGDNLLAALDSDAVGPANLAGQRLPCVVERVLSTAKKSVVSLPLDQGPISRISTLCYKNGKGASTESVGTDARRRSKPRSNGSSESSINSKRSKRGSERVLLTHTDRATIG